MESVGEEWAELADLALPGRTGTIKGMLCCEIGKPQQHLKESKNTM